MNNVVRLRSFGNRGSWGSKLLRKRHASWRFPEQEDRTSGLANTRQQWAQSSNASALYSQSPTKRWVTSQQPRHLSIPFKADCVRLRLANATPERLNDCIAALPLLLAHAPPNLDLQRPPNGRPQRREGHQRELPCRRELACAYACIEWHEAASRAQIEVPHATPWLGQCSEKVQLVCRVCLCKPDPASFPPF